MIIETLKVFVEVAEQSNFSRAAERLNLSQPGVSIHIRNLENDFGIKLIHRTSKIVKLTEAGHILYTNAKQILSLYEQTREEIHALLQEVTGSIKIGASFTIGEYVLPYILAKFTHQYPKVDLQVNISNTEDIVQAIRSTNLDIALVEGQVDQEELKVGPPFMQDEMVVIAPPDDPLCSIPIKVDAKMLQDRVWVMRESGSGTRAYSELFIANSKLRIKRMFEFNSTQSVKEAVMAGLGIAMLSNKAIAKEVEAERLSYIPIKGRRYTRDYQMIQQPDHGVDTMAIKMFKEMVAQTIS